MLHVPLCTENTDILKSDTIKFWKEPLLIGEDCSYILDNNTKEFISMVTNNNSPVVEVLAGHLHFYHRDKLNNNIVQYVSDGSAYGIGTMITIEPN